MQKNEHRLIVYRFFKQILAFLVDYINDVTIFTKSIPSESNLKVSFYLFSRYYPSKDLFVN